MLSAVTGGCTRNGVLGVVLALLCGLGGAAHAQDGRQDDQNGQRVLEAFAAQAEQKQRADEERIATKRKHEILFYMGFLLLIGVLVTAGLGIAMGVYGKPVFLAHMVAAGLTVTLAIVHAVVAIVWFFPF